MSYQYLNFTVENRLATITLNRPEVGNTFHIDFARELVHVTRLCQTNSDIGAVLLNANGDMFSGGGDLENMKNNFDQLDFVLKELADCLHTAYTNIMRLEVPVVIAVNGPAAGIGLSLALVGDITIASEKASFVPAYAKVGLSPDGGLTYFLPRLIGMKRAQEMLLCSRALSANEAEEWGLINRVVAADQLAEQALKTATQLANGPTKSFASIKKLLAMSESQAPEAQMHFEGIELSKNSMNEDAKAGIAAFMNKQKPVFTGR